VAAREERLGPEAFRDADLLRRSRSRWRKVLAGYAELQPVSVTITQSGQEIPVINVETHRG